jgi:glyoxalase family protein
MVSSSIIPYTIYDGIFVIADGGYSVPEGSLDFWIRRFEEFNVIYNKVSEKFGEKYLTFLDPDGLKLELIISAVKDERKPWITPAVNESVATRGFHNITLTLSSIDKTIDILTNIFGYTLREQKVNRYRFATDAINTASMIDLVEVSEHRGHVAGGTVHHVAFRVTDDAVQQVYRNKLLSLGLNPTTVMDRNYFHSVYFREPGGVLFEIATDNPGFTVDEPQNELGTHLKLPTQYEPGRKEIEKILPEL